MKDIQIFVVTTGYSYEGPSGQWVFLDEAPARAKYEEVAAEVRANTGDYVVLDGPFTPGENVHYMLGKQLAYCNPKQEAVEAARRAMRKKSATA